MLNQNQSCNPDREIPIIHIHGTSDNTVPYNSTFDGSMYVSQSIAFWREFNGLTEEYVNSVPNFDIFDGTTVEDYTYSKDGSTTLFKHLKVIGGGHQWFGSTVADNYIYFLGLNNHDIHSNTELILFFQDYRLSDFYPQGTHGDVNGDGDVYTWIGDAYCDDGSYGLVFTCDEFSWDCGDCGDAVVDPNGWCAGGGDTGGGGCSASDWECDDGSCIPGAWECDVYYCDCSSLSLIHI